MDSHSLVHDRPEGNLLPPLKHHKVTFLRTLHKHCKPQTKIEKDIKFSAKLSKFEGGKKRTKDRSTARASWALKSQQFTFSGGGGGDHSWLHFNTELAFNPTGDPRNTNLIQQEIPEIPSPHYCPQPFQGDNPRMLRSSCNIINFMASEPAQNDQIWLFLT